MTMSNIHSPETDANRTDAEQAMGRLVTDAVAAVIDERRHEGEGSISLDELESRLALQFNNVPGFNVDEFNLRARASLTADANEARRRGTAYPGPTTSKVTGMPSQPSHPQADRGTAKIDASARKAEESNRKAG